MFKHYFERIADQVAIYPIFSLVIFFAFFLSLLIWVFTVNKEYINHMASMPVESDPESNN